MNDLPTDLRYSADHLWVRASSQAGSARVGITNFAQESLGDVVAVTAPEVGATVTAGDPCGEIESTKSINDLVAPITGGVTAINDDLGDSPDLVNTDPYGRGWLFDVHVDPAELGEQLAQLIDAAGYRKLTGE
jgi:glycine cleavage system H protein